MPNAAAHFDDDFGIETPARKKAPRRSASAKSSPAQRRKKGKSRFAFAFDAKSLTRYAAIGMSGTVVVGILFNALILQKGHHPAPLFGKAIALGEGTAAANPVMPAPAPKKAEDAPAAATTKSPRAERTAAREDKAPSSDDAIGRLLQGGSQTSPTTDRPSQKTVLGIQRALTRVGMTVKQTGTFGPQTRKAIERFEKEHPLPVKGEITRRLLKALASEAHVKIEQ